MTEAPDCRPNEPIDLGGVRGLRLDGGDEIEARAVLRLLPRPGLELRATTRLLAWETDRVFPVKWSRGNEGNFFVTSRKTRLSAGGPSSQLALVPARQPLRVNGGSQPPAVEVGFLVLNFPNFFGGQDERRDHEGGGSSWHGRIQIEASPWRVELRECRGLQNNVEELRATRGFGATHHGRIVRMDQTPIEADEADLFLRALEDFLSFARGAACAVSMVDAKSTNGGTVWQLWGCRRVDPWSVPDGWFDPHHGSQLSDAFPGFWRVYSACADKRNALHEVIYWYLRSRTEQSGVDGGLILMQAALERLAHTILGPMPSNQKRRWLRSALSRHDIPVEIPDKCGPLREYVDSLNGPAPADAVLALVSLRNNAVHPRKDADVPEGAYFHAWNAARWFIELLILGVTDYSGSYGNRLRSRSVGEVESVPWVAADGRAATNRDTEL